MRLPLCPLDERSRELLIKSLKDYGLLTQQHMMRI